MKSFSKEDLKANIEYAIILDNKGKFLIYHQEDIHLDYVYYDTERKLNQLLIDFLEEKGVPIEKYSEEKTVEINIIKTNNKLVLITPKPIPYVIVVKLIFALAGKAEEEENKRQKAKIKNK